MSAQIVKVKWPTPASIDPTINNGKTEVEAGEESYVWATTYLQMMTWPENLAPQRTGDFIFCGDLPTDDESIASGTNTATTISTRIKKQVDTEKATQAS